MSTEEWQLEVTMNDFISNKVISRDGTPIAFLYLSQIYLFILKGSSTSFKR